jgi:uncharacterized RDD family membrane protein YckC
MASITILKDNAPNGPFTRAEVAEKLQAGEYSLDSLAFVDGLTQWTPLRDVLARVDAAAAPLSAPLVAQPPLTPQAYSYAATMQPPSHLVYAGFWRRFAAIFIDGLILLPLVIVYVVLDVIALGSNDDNIKMGMGVFLLVYWLFLIVAQWLYFTLQESGVHQATFGKRLLDIRVTDMRGQRVGFGRASGRYFGKILSGLILYIGFMMAGWTPRKQALHDMLADTLVVLK